FPYERHGRGNCGEQGGEINHPAEWHLVIRARKKYIMDVASHQTRRHFAQPLGVIQEREIVSDLRMSEIMPVADCADLGKEAAKFSFRRACLHADTIFDGNYNACRCSMIDDRFEPLSDAIKRGVSLSFLDSPQFHSDVRAAQIPS